jgi:PIN domain nuclease of toxin-antitoxin system
MRRRPTATTTYYAAGPRRVTGPRKAMPRHSGRAPKPIGVEIAVASTRLPGTPHGDLADRIIVATARHLGVQLVTAVGPLLEYAE